MALKSVKKSCETIISRNKNYEQKIEVKFNRY